MYYPKQVPYLLSKEFNQYIEYTEYPVPKIKDYVMCIWCMKSKKILEKTIYNYILPDACIDIVIDFTNHSICFAGFSKETIPFELNKKIDYMGVRLKPGAFYTIFSIQADKIMDHPINFFEIENNCQLENIFQIEGTEERIQLVKAYLLTKINLKDTQYIELVEELYKEPRNQTVLNIANRLGYDTRHLFRIFKKQYGISPKVLLNILRLHKCLTLLEEKKPFKEIMNHCGFYDQSHFIKEIKRYTGFSPLELLESHSL